MKKGVVIILVIGAMLAMSFSRNGGVSLQVPNGWPKPAYDLKKHPLNTNVIALGRRLFYDPGLSADSTISCASCHLSYTAFAHTDHNLSHGIKGLIGTRNAPALFNLAWTPELMWDGAVRDIYKFAEKPITNPLEMNEQVDHVVARINATGHYTQGIHDAFGTEKMSEEQFLGALG